MKIILLKDVMCFQNSWVTIIETKVSEDKESFNFKKVAALHNNKNYIIIFQKLKV